MQSDIIFVERCECECKKLFCRKVWVWMQESWKVSVIFSFPSHTRIPPKSPLLLSDFAAPKVSPSTHFLGCIRQKFQPLFPYSFPCSLFLSSSLLTSQPSLSHQNKISLSKEEIKGSTLKFQLQIVGGK